MHIRLSDARHRDWLFAALLVAGTELQIWLAHGARFAASDRLRPATAPPPRWRSGLQDPATNCIVAQGSRRRAQSTSGTVCPPSPCTIASVERLHGLAAWAAPRASLIGRGVRRGHGHAAAARAGKSRSFSLTVCLSPFGSSGRHAAHPADRPATATAGRAGRAGARPAAREAVVEERARIARELHDAIAHNVSMMVVQAGAERRVLGLASSARRGKCCKRSSRSGAARSSRCAAWSGCSGATAGSLSHPSPARDLPTLVAQVREAGLPVELRVDGEHASCRSGSTVRLPDRARGAENALKHAGEARAVGRCSLRRRLARARDRRRRGGTAPPLRAAATGWSACANGSPSTAAASTRPATRRRLHRPRSAADPMTSAHRRRPGARPRRLAEDPGGGAGSTSSAKPATGRTRRGGRGSARRGAHGHPDAGARRHRGDPAHHPRPAAPGS